MRWWMMEEELDCETGPQSIIRGTQTGRVSTKEKTNRHSSQWMIPRVPRVGTGRRVPQR